MNCFERLGIKLPPKGSQRITWGPIRIPFKTLDNIDDIALVKFTSTGAVIKNVTWGGSDIESVNSLIIASGYPYGRGYTASYGNGTWDVFLVNFSSFFFAEFNINC